MCPSTVWLSVRRQSKGREERWKHLSKQWLLYNTHFCKYLLLMMLLTTVHCEKHMTKTYKFNSLA